MLRPYHIDGVFDHLRIDVDRASYGCATIPGLTSTADRKWWCVTMRGIDSI
jgi:hypothetical protein